MYIKVESWALAALWLAAVLIGVNEFRRLHIQPEQEQQKNDAELGDAADELRIVDEGGAGWTENHAGHDIHHDQWLASV